MRYYLFEPKLFTARFPTGPAGEVLEFPDWPKTPKDRGFCVVPRDIDRQPILTTAEELHEVIGNSIDGLIISARLREVLLRFRLDDGLEFGPCTVVDRMDRWSDESFWRLSSLLGTRSVIDLDAARVHLDYEGKIYDVMSWAIDGARLPDADLFFAEKYKFIASEQIVAACREHNIVGCKFTEIPVAAAYSSAVPVWGETVNHEIVRRDEEVKQFAVALDGQPEEKIPCGVCGREILMRTAIKTDGRCRVCERDAAQATSRQAEDEYQDWARRPLTRVEFENALYFDDLDELIGVFHDKAAWRMLEHRLSPGELMILVVETFFAEVNNGGFYQFLTNPSGELTQFLPEAFRCLNIPQFVELANEVTAVLPDLATDPTSIATHCESIDAIWFERMDSRFFGLSSQPDTSLYACRRGMRAYIAAHPEDFIHA